MRIATILTRRLGSRWSPTSSSAIGPQLKPQLAPLLLLALAIAYSAVAAEPTRQPAPNAVAATAPALHTATSHPMKYYLSLPNEWSTARTWPVLVAPSAHYGDKGKTLGMFAAERDARRLPFIIVSPLVINADRVAPMIEYRGAVADAIARADAADGFRDEEARAKFDSEGIIAILHDLQKQYRAHDRVYITGFSSSTHVAYLFLFTHPELLRGVVINSGVYLARGVDEDNVPLLNGPERAHLPVKFIIGETDPGYAKCVENWEATRAELLRDGHSAARLQAEIVRVGNAAHLPTGHTWFPTRIWDFCTSVEREPDS